MDVPSLELQCETETHPLIMERTENVRSTEHIVDVSSSADVSTSSSPYSRYSIGFSSTPHQFSEHRNFSATPASTAQTSISSNGSNSRQSSSIRRGDARRRRSPLNSGLWLSIELVLTASQIVAAIVVLSLSRDEKPHTPLFAWIVGYTCGCFAILPLLYWRYRHHNQGLEQDSDQARQASTQINVPAGPFSLSVSRMSDGEDLQPAIPSPRSNQSSIALISARLKVLVEYLKIASDCFFAVWFVVGLVWMSAGRSSASDAPNLYRLCMVFLVFCALGYALPFILCITICCCLPCMISALGFREDLTRTRGATSESIDALPTYKFKMKNTRNGDDRESNLGAGGVVAAGTEKEREILGEDAVCCICLAQFADNDELRELPCSHFFHKDCVDKWLIINALCPLCKGEVGENIMDSQHGTHTNNQQPDESRVAASP